MNLPFEICLRTLAVIDQYVLGFLNIANDTVNIAYSSVVFSLSAICFHLEVEYSSESYLSPKKTLLRPRLAWTPQLEVVMTGILGVDLT